MRHTKNGIHKNTTQNTNTQRFKRSPELIQRQLSPHLLQSQYTPPMHNDDDLLFHPFSRDGSHTPPLFANYNTYPAPEENFFPPYPQQHHQQQYQQPYDTTYLTQQAPVTLPSMMHFSDIKREPEEVLAPFNLSYDGLAPIDMHAANAYDMSNPHVSPL